MKESPRDKFARLATNRVNNALKYIWLIGNLSNRSNYDYTSEDIEKIFATLGEGLRESRRRFPAREPNRKFKLK